MSACSTWFPPRSRAPGGYSSACVALRFGRNPIRTRDRKSAPGKSAAARASRPCAQRDDGPVGMPRGRWTGPWAFGDVRTAAGCGRYMHARNAMPNPPGRTGPPCCGIASSVCEMTPPRHASSSPAATPPEDVIPPNAVAVGRESVVSIARPRPTGVVAIGARDRPPDGGGEYGDRSCRPCPCACLRPHRVHRRGPSLPSRCSS